jgi:hypothetical protein
MQNRLVLVLFVIGCGGGGGVSIGALPDELEDAQCKNAVACQGIADKMTCENAIDFDNEDYRTIKAGVDDGTIKYDADKAGDCVDSFGNTDCSFAGFHDENPCEDIFTGTVATGGACVIDEQCANGGECVVAGSCDPEVTCCTGACMGSLLESPVGGPCGDETHVCALDAYCKTSETGPGTCTAVITAEGAACEDIDACANPMYCNVLTAMPTCKKPAASGATCSRMDLLPCTDSREYCDATSLKCTPRVAVGGACSAQLPCVGFASCIGGSCMADLPAGAACQNTATSPDCAGNLECTNGTCALPPIGMTCMLP